MTRQSGWSPTRSEPTPSKPSGCRSSCFGREAVAPASHGKRWFEYGRWVTDKPGTEDLHQPLVVDREGVIRRWESECAGVFGYSSEEALGETLDLVVPRALQA